MATGRPQFLALWDFAIRLLECLPNMMAGCPQSEPREGKVQAQCLL